MFRAFYYLEISAPMFDERKSLHRTLQRAFNLHLENKQ